MFCCGCSSCVALVLLLCCSCVALVLLLCCCCCRLVVLCAVLVVVVVVVVVECWIHVHMLTTFFFYYYFPLSLSLHQLICIYIAGKSCLQQMNFLMQIYAPIGSGNNNQLKKRAFHRSLYVFCCRNGKCLSKTTTINPGGRGGGGGGGDGRDGGDGGDGGGEAGEEEADAIANRNDEAGLLVLRCQMEQVNEFFETNPVDSDSEEEKEEEEEEEEEEADSEGRSQTKTIETSHKDRTKHLFEQLRIKQHDGENDLLFLYSPFIDCSLLLFLCCCCCCCCCCICM